MFTGIIQTTCFIKFISNNRLFIDTKNNVFWKSVKDGDSISINGVCLTITFDDILMKNFAVFDLSNETISVSTLNIENYQLNIFFNCNVEKSLRYLDYLGGHIVSGHVEKTGIIHEIVNFDNCMDIIVKIAGDNRNKIRYKGSIAINGVSLTIADLNFNNIDTFIRISLIPTTIKQTIFNTIKQYDLVNIEWNHQEQNNANIDINVYLMERAIQLGEKGRETAQFNPWVGCVFSTPQGEIIGEGYHHSAGSDHAERVAYLNALELGNEKLIKDCNVYITLEPCSHYGRTPPCDQLLIDLQVGKVFIACNDPDPITSGKGIINLEQNGIIVQQNLCIEKATESLKAYFYQRKTGMPYTIAKIAVSIDGMYCFNDYSSQWITGELAREHGRLLRTTSQAIIVGTNTLLYDNPQLNVRIPGYTGKQPIVVVLDRTGDFQENNSNLNVFKNKNTIVFKKLDCNLKNVLQTLASKYGVLQCLIEGGAILQSSFLKEHFLNEFHIYRANCIIGNKGLNLGQFIEIPMLSMKPQWKLLNTEIIGHDILEKYAIIAPLLEDVKITTCISKCIQQKSLYDTIEDALEYIKIGKPIIVMDNEDRENEGDIMIPAQFITTEQMALIIRNTTGIVCASMPPEWASQKGLPLMTTNEDPLNTAFTITCDSKNTHTGVSAFERVQTMKVLSDPLSPSTMLKKPGHIFPLIAKNLLDRQGHTEAGVTLCQLAGLNPVMVLAELQKENGDMMRRDDCLAFAKEHDMKIITTEQLLAYYLTPKCMLLAETNIYLNGYEGVWKFSTFHSDNINFPHRVLMKGDCGIDDYIPIRIHSECFTGDVLGSCLCDCGEQLKLSKDYINSHDKGIIIFPSNHEGRGIGLTNKIKAYNLMQRDSTIDTYSANCILGFKDDTRSFDDCVNILKKLVPFRKITLLTKNPDKINNMTSFFHVKSEPLLVLPNKYNTDYQSIKNKKHVQVGFKKEPIHYMSNLPDKSVIQSATLKICIIKAQWHNLLINPFIDEYINKLIELGVNIDDISQHIVPGTYEIVSAVKDLIKTNKYNAIFCMGILIKGDTLHFETVLNSVNNGLSQLQLQYDTPIINNILSCFNDEQVIERTSVESELILSLAITTLYMALKKYL